ncbi:MAG TPA: putative porin [Geobacteraceae bacterium]|nr:putative porin [Geobacteraceae bacterium]
MKRSGAWLAGFALLLMLVLIVSPVSAAEQAAADTGGDALGGILDLLKEKKVINDEESAAFIRRMVYKSLAREDLKALVDLLREKGVISGQEAASFIQNIGSTPLTGLERTEVAKVPAEGVQEDKRLMLPASDSTFKSQLRELWIKKGNRGVDFDAQFKDINDPEEIIGRMRVMGTITPAYAEKLDNFYREKYLSGAVTTVLETKEKDYLDRLKRDVSWDIDDKIHGIMDNEWIRRIHLSGDIRFRFEDDIFANDNADLLQPSNPSQIMNTKIDRQRFRIRFRLNVDAKVAKWLEVGAGISTGTTTNPSPNVTLGDSFMNKSIVLSKAYMKITPLPDLTIWAGRFESPWFYTDLVWYPDLNFDGIAVQYTPKLSRSWDLFVVGGVFPLQDVEFSQRDKWLFGGQVVGQYTQENELTAKLGVAFYDYEHTVGIVNNPAMPGATNWTAPQFQQKGNTLMDIDPSTNILTAYASAFRELNITGSLDLGYWQPIHAILVGDYVNNLGFDLHEVSVRAGTNVRRETEGYQIGLVVGQPTVREFGDWKGLFFYKYLESDAVMDAYTDQDFHLGGTNAKGWIFGGDFGLYKNVWLSTRWYTANEISGPPLAIDVLQVNLNAKF